MTAPEDQNGLREALADKALRKEVRDCIGETIPLRRRWVSALMAGPIARLIAERDAALAELERVLDPEMKDLHLANGGIDMAVAGPMVERLAVAMTGWFRQSGAENYVEMGLNARTEPFGRYCVTVQKYGAMSPHQLRQAAETRALAAEAEITRLKEGMEALGAALMPFARAADAYPISPVARRENRRQCEVIWSYGSEDNGNRREIAVSDLRNAAQALATLSPKEQT